MLKSMKKHLMTAFALVALPVALAQTVTTDTSVPTVKVVLKKTKTEKTAAGTITFYDDTNTTGTLHTPGKVTYPFFPPVRGMHYPAWYNCGVYLKAVDDRLAVHSMEHGALWITYKSTTDRKKLDFLQGLARNNPYRLMTMHTRQKADVVLSAWGVQLVVSKWDEKAIKAFADKYTNNPETTPEFGAPCSGAFNP